MPSFLASFLFFRDTNSTPCSLSTVTHSIQDDPPTQPPTHGATLPVILLGAPSPIQNPGNQYSSVTLPINTCNGKPALDFVYHCLQKALAFLSKKKHKF